MIWLGLALLISLSLWGARRYQRWRDLRSQIDEHLVAGRPVPPDLRDEEAALTAKLKK